MKREILYFGQLVFFIIISIFWISCETEERTLVGIAALGSTKYEGSPSKVPELVDWLKDDDYKYRREAAHSLGRLAKDFPDNNQIIKVAIPALLETLNKDEDVRVRLQAAVALGNTKHSSALNGLVSSFNDRHENIIVRARAAEAHLNIAGTEESVICIPILAEAMLHWAVKPPHWVKFGPRGQAANVMEKMITDGGLKIKSFSSSLSADNPNDHDHGHHQHDHQAIKPILDPVSGTLELTEAGFAKFTDGQTLTFRLPWKTYYLIGKTPVTQLNEVSLQINNLDLTKRTLEVKTSFDLTNATIVAVNGNSLSLLRDTEYQNQINVAFKNYMLKHPADFTAHYHQ